MNSKTCLILGANSDVGQAVAYVFAKNNHNIILATRHIDAYQERLATDIAIRNGVKVENVYFDASKYEEHRAFYENLPTKPDVLISVFGYLGNQDIALENFDETYNILQANFIGHVSIINIISRDMSDRRSGVIIGVSSVAGDRGRKKNFIYGAAKAGFTQYLSGLRGLMYEKGVHVATIIPGFINTKMIKGIETPKKLTAQPAQVAKAIWKAYIKRKHVVYVLPIWRFIMLIIKNIPERIFKKMNF